MFRYRSLLSERKQNTLIWSKKFLTQADRFHFDPKIMGRSKAIWFVLEIVLGKVEHNYLIQKLKDWNKTFWFGSLIIGTKAKHFDLAQKFFITSMSFLFLSKNSETKQSNLVWSGNCCRQSRTFLFLLYIEAKRFDLVFFLSERKQNVLIWFAYYMNERKEIWFGLKLSQKKNLGLRNNQLQKSISQKLIKIMERNSQRVFFYTCTASSSNLSFLALL
jgi:hypothetical protein